jgi:tetratricopeptide (TPR) repeat protein
VVRRPGPPTARAAPGSLAAPRSLLQGVDARDQDRDRALAYTFQPVIAQVLRSRAETHDLGAARERYAAWAAQMIGQAYGKGGIDYSEEVARRTEFYLPDLVAALPYRPAERRGWDAWQMAFILRKFGRIAEATQALGLAEQTAQEISDQKLAERVQVERAKQAVLRGDLGQALEDFQAALTLTDDSGEQGERAAILYAMAGVLVTRGDLDQAMQLYQQILQGGETLGDVQGKSATLHAMAGVLVTRGDLDGAMQLYQQSLQIKESLGDVQGKSATLHAMAGVLVTRGDLDGAMRLYQQSLRLYEALGDVRGKSATLNQMANVLVTRGDLDGAMQLYQQSLQIKEALGDVRGKATSLLMIAQLLVMRGERGPALAAARESIAIFTYLRAPRELAQAREILATIEAWTNTARDTAPATPARLAAALAAMVTAALRGEPSEQARAALGQAAQDAQLGAYAAALAAVLDRESGAAGDLLAAAETLLAEASLAERIAS